MLSDLDFGFFSINLQLFGPLTKNLFYSMSITYLVNCSHLKVNHMNISGTVYLSFRDTGSFWRNVSHKWPSQYMPCFHLNLLPLQDFPNGLCQTRYFFIFRIENRFEFPLLVHLYKWWSSPSSNRYCTQSSNCHHQKQEQVPVSSALPI